MALYRCPECRKKISETAKHCPHCGFIFNEENLTQYRQALEKRRMLNAEINRKSTKLHLIWLVIFTLVIVMASWWYG